MNDLMLLCFAVLWTAVLSIATPPSSNCTGTLNPKPEFSIEWSVNATVVSFIVTARANGDFWAAVGFTENTESPFMVS